MRQASNGNLPSKAVADVDVEGSGLLTKLLLADNQVSLPLYGAHKARHMSDNGSYMICPLNATMAPAYFDPPLNQDKGM